MTLDESVELMVEICYGFHTIHLTYKCMTNIIDPVEGEEEVVVAPEAEEVAPAADAAV